MWGNSSKTRKIFTNHWQIIIDSLSLDFFPFLKKNIFLPRRGGFLAKTCTLVLWSSLNDTRIFYFNLRDHLQVGYCDGLEYLEWPSYPSHIDSAKWRESFRQSGFYEYLGMCKVSYNIYCEMILKCRKFSLIYLHQLHKNQNGYILFPGVSIRNLTFLYLSF